MKKKIKLRKWVKNMLIAVSSIILYLLLSKYGYLAGINYFYTFLVIIGWSQLFIGNVVLLYLVNEY